MTSSHLDRTKVLLRLLALLFSFFLFVFRWLLQSQLHGCLDPPRWRTRWRRNRRDPSSQSERPGRVLPPLLDGSPVKKKKKRKEKERRRRGQTKKKKTSSSDRTLNLESKSRGGQVGRKTKGTEYEISLLQTVNKRGSQQTEVEHQRKPPLKKKENKKKEKEWPPSRLSGCWWTKTKTKKEKKKKQIKSKIEQWSWYQYLYR